MASEGLAQAAVGVAAPVAKAAGKSGLMKMLGGAGRVMGGPWFNAALMALMLGPEVVKLFTKGYEGKDTRKARETKAAEAQALAHMSAGIGLKEKMDPGLTEEDMVLQQMVENFMGGSYGFAGQMNPGGTATASEGVGGMGPQILQALSEQAGEEIDATRFDKAVASPNPPAPFAGDAFLRKRTRGQNPMNYNLGGEY